jgi:hypothetical protein
MNKKCFQCDGYSCFITRTMPLTMFLPHQPKTVDDAKLSQYTAGNSRKSKREKEQEAAEAKKREEEADAQRAYVEFLDAFEGEGVGRRSGTTFVKAESQAAYTPHERQPTSVSRKLNKRVCRLIMSKMQGTQVMLVVIS